ncbi:hypothetical protein ABZ372_19320, partial [Streptomyces sp. NPDC005921]
VVAVRTRPRTAAWMWAITALYGFLAVSAFGGVHDSQVAEAFRDVSFMVVHPATLLVPDLVRRAARANGVPDEEFDREYGSATEVA